MKRNFSSIGLHSFQGIWALPQIPLCVNHVSGTFCKLSVDNYSVAIAEVVFPWRFESESSVGSEHRFEK